MLFIISGNIPKLSLKPESMPNNQVRLSGLHAARNALNEISQIKALSSICADVLKQDPLFHSPLDSVIADSNAANAFIGSANAIIQQANLVASLLIQSISEPSPTQIDIKLPEVTSLEEAANILSKLSATLDNTSRRVVGDGVSLAGFDSGSWYVLLLPITKRVLNFLLDVFDKLLAMRGKLLEQRETELKVKSLELDVGLKRTVTEAMQLELSAYAKSLADSLIKIHACDEATDDEKNEARNAIVASLWNLNEFLDNGGQIRPSLNADSEVKQLFPQALTATSKPERLLPQHRKEEDEGKGS